MDWLEGRSMHHVMDQQGLDEWLERPLPDTGVDLENVPPEDRDRATRLLELRPIYNQLGSQPAELRTTVEPFNPLSPASSARFTRKIFSGLGLPGSASDFGLSVLSRRLVDACYPADLSSFFNLPDKDLFLFDPMMGFLLWTEGGRHHNAWFGNARDLLETQLKNPAMRELLIRSRDDHFNLGFSLYRQIVQHLHRIPKFAFDTAKIPTVEVGTQRELDQLVDDLRNACEHSPLHVRTLFRGQSSEYQLPDRARIIRKGLCTYSNYRDHSIIPSLYRSYDKHLSDLPDFRAFLSRMLDWNYFSDVLFGDPAMYYTMDDEPYVPRELPEGGAFVEAAIGVTGEREENRLFEDLGWYSVFTLKDPAGNVIEQYKKRYRHGQKNVQRNLILQHYGAPTPFIDVTYDIRVAEWFALHKVDVSPDGLAIGTQHPGPFDQAAIYVLLTMDGLTPVANTSDLVSSSEALRPHRQACGLLGGAGNLYRNAPARFIALKIKFAPTFVPENLPTASWLFPGPDEDPALAKLLQMDAESRSSRSAFPVYWFGKAAETA